MPSGEKLKVLFLCTANSCRSQMAEGWATSLKAGLIDAYSAGVKPARLSSRAVQVMAEAGVDISDHISKHPHDLQGIEFDYVITVCDNAKENCPVFTGKTRLIHKSFQDPTCVFGTKEETLAAFRKVRDQIRAFVETLPESLNEE
jgi:arsenate reductase